MLTCPRYSKFDLHEDLRLLQTLGAWPQQRVVHVAKNSLPAVGRGVSREGYMI